MVEGPVSNRRFSRRQVRSFLMTGGGIVVALLVIVGGWQLYSSSLKASAREEQKAREQFIAEQASSAAAPFTALQRKLDKLAAAPATIRLFAAGDKARLEAAGASRLGAFDGGLKLRYVIPGNTELDNEANPPLGYASLDLLNRAARDDSRIVAEAVLPGSPKGHVVMLSRVKNDAGELTGILHLSVSESVFDNALASLATPGAYVELQQGSGSRTLVLAGNGDASVKSGEPVVASVPGTRFKVAVWTPASASATGGGSGGIPLLLIVAAVVAVIVLLAVVFFLRRGETAGDGEGNEVVYEGAVRAIMDGAHPGMEKLVPGLPQGDGSAAATGSISQGAVGDDITMIMNKDEVKAAAESEIFDLTSPESAEAATASAAETPQPSPVSPAEPGPAPAPETSVDAADSVEVSAAIFRTYDIRGVVGETLNADVVRRIGQAIGSEAATQDQARLVVGRDGRTSSPELAEALIQGLRDAGRDVIDIGVVPTPVLYFATHFLETGSGIMLTGSHNGPTYNGLKIVINGDTLSEDGIQAIYKRVTENNYETGQGSLETREIIADYIRRISEDIPVAFGNAYKVVVDCGNGVAGAVAPQLFRALGHDVVELYCDIDGNFPNHHPDPSQPENMQDLIDRVKAEEADLGFAFDGDADRLGVVDDLGNIIWPDRQLMLLAKDVLSRNQGSPIIFDVKCSRYLKAIIESNGGQPLMWKTGHSLIKKKMKEVEAPLAGEMSGHIFFKERWYGFDDALYTGARLLEILMAADARPAQTFAELPEGVSTPELRLDLPESAHQTFMTELEGRLSFEGAEIIDIDGYRVEFSDGWGLIRPSNTTPCLVMRFEAEDKAALERIQGEFRNVLLGINPDLKLPF